MERLFSEGVIKPFSFRGVLSFIKRLTHGTDDVHKTLRAFVLKKIGYNPKRMDWYVLAFTHRSALDSMSVVKRQTRVQPAKISVITKSNERLEFLGDAVLDLIVASYLFENLPNCEEGALTKLRSQIVNTVSLASHCRRLSFDEKMIVGDDIDAASLRKSDYVLADLLEAVIGAMYLDAGYTFTKGFVERNVLSILDFNSLLEQDKNYKSALLEITHYYRFGLPVYVLLEENGPPHNREFIVGVKVHEKMLGTGTGKTKKEAEQQAAKQAVSKIKPPLA